MKTNLCTAELTRTSALRGLGIATVVLALTGTGAVQAKEADDCEVGIYQLPDGSHIDVGASDDDRLRWRRNDGTTGALTRSEDGVWTSTFGWTERADGNQVTFDCRKDTITFAGVDGQRIALDVTDVVFDGAGVQLAGRLVMPEGDARVPIAVLVHGSEHSSALDSYSLQRQLPAEGIGVFVYDKRGTGASTGTYTQNYLLLANDAIAAVHEARRLAGDRAGKIGYQAGSQGGWVAPLAAKIEPVDFLIVGFGLAVSPLDEDRQAIEQDLTSRGYGPEVVAKAMEVADATAAIIVNGFRDGYDQLAKVRARYGDEPWFEHVRGNISFYLLDTPEATAREEGPAILSGVPAHYNPMPVLRNLDTPQLWILAENDSEAPSDETQRRLRGLAAQGKPITVAVFPDTDHGIYEYETTGEGKRVFTRNPDGYLAMMLDYIHNGYLDDRRYGTSTISTP
ncbi:alpha/beta hydrolase family protein [Novilysobacter erysipheiresistens]|uniref:Alpha/beta fold hydrolase n=1 Tax=Novilysobacter erysipheiresistens TaxID=1749332 RepID=A0ABU7YXL6_9GAMM